MSSNRDRQSRFGPPNNYGGSNPIPLMNLKTGMPRSFDQDSIFSPHNIGPPSNNYKTPEQLAFDNEFKKWEKSFEDWKRAYANHPDRVAYREYERKFLEVREKLIEKRKQIYVEERGSGPSSFSSSFDNQLFAADAMASSILSKFGEPRDFREDDRYRGGYLEDRNRGNFQSSAGRDNSRGNDRNNRNMGMERDSRSGGRNDRNMAMGRDSRSGGRNDRNMGRDNRSGGRNDRNMGMGRDNRSGGRNDRNMGRDNRFGSRDDRGGNRNNDRGFDRRMQKPSQDQIMKDLSRRDVYPHNRWVLISRDDRPPLVGKRAKKKNSKIQNVIERKRKIAAGEIPLEELPFSERIDKMFELARSAELPKLLPGSMNRRLRNIRKKNEQDLTAEERKFLAYCDFVSVKRAKYFEEKKKHEEEEAKQKGENNIEEAQTPMEQEPSQA